MQKFSQKAKLKKNISSLPNFIIAVFGVEDPSSSKFNILQAFDIVYNIFSQL